MASCQFPVAIIGIATRLPGAQTCDDFWELLKHGGDTVGKFPEERKPDIEQALALFQDQLINEDEPFFTGSFFPSVDKFDNKLFQINPKEALFIEPEQRLFLESTWEALEDAGYAATIRGSKTGVYVGNTVNKYKYILTENHPSISHGNHSPFISSRVSYTHNLQGPAMMIATGCSSSLLAVHVACQGLLSGDCEMAIAGGITLDLLPISVKTDIWNQLGITGPDVKCRAFDASAKGIAKGEGCGVVLLKPLEKAEMDGDNIYGVLEATTTNQDGHSNGITAPHPGAQANMLCKAWKLANISPERLGYFEAHGTGTELGDPIEISGIRNAFKSFGLNYHHSSQDARKIPIGSVKANIGHLADGAAGVVSLIKVLLCLHYENIPPAVNFSKPNPHINWDTSPVYVNTSLTEWRSREDNPTRYASVSAFGLLGTNVHAVVRDYHGRRTVALTHLSAGQPQESQLLTLAANTKLSLVMLVRKIVKFCQENKNTSYEMLRNVCYTMNTGREQTRFAHRAVTYAQTWKSMTEALENLDRHLSTKASAKEKPSNSRCWGYACNGDITSSGGLPRQVFPCYFSCDAEQFLDGKDISWKRYYAEMNELERVPLVPTYAFERTRFWPKSGKAINGKLLALEHRLTTTHHVTHSDPGRSETPNLAGKCQQNEIEEEIYSTAPRNVDVKTAIYTALNDILGEKYDWQNMWNENLFKLGMDSLMCTQLSIKLRDAINCCISLKDIHKNSSCAGLINLVEERMSPQAPTGIITRDPAAEIHIPTQKVVNSVLGRALNQSLDTNYDWTCRGNDNLFALGFDSLTSTQVNMELANVLNLKEPFTMAELRKFPTYSLLCKVIWKKLDPNTPPEESHKVNRVILGKENDSEQQSTFPLSFSQRRLWVMEEMSTSSCAYNATNCLRITGIFHPEAFTAAANTVTSRHAAFFTTITDTKEGPTQNYDWQLDVKVKEREMRHFGLEAEERSMELYRNDYKTRFDLRTGPPVRCTLYRLPDKVFYFTMVVHHIVFDGWSHFVFHNELWDTYAKLCEGKIALEDIHRPLYAEFAKQEQHEFSLSSSKMEAHVAYWKEKLASPLPLTTFPGDKRRPAVFSHQGKRITRFLDKDVQKIMRDCGSEKYTVFMKLLSAVYSLLHLYTGETDLIIGTPVAGRTELIFKHVIGCFVNTIALRVQLPDNCSFSDILSEVSGVFLEAFDHQMAPFDYVLSQLNLPRDTSITPVFSVNVCYHNTEIKAEHVGPPSEISVERKLQHNGTTKWDLQFDFLKEPEGMRFTLEYYSDLFSDQYAEGIVDNFVWLLMSCCENKSIPLSQLALSTLRKVDANQAQLSKVSILRGPVRVCEKSLSGLLLESCRTHAERTAITKASNVRITYSELLEQSAKISLFLRNVCLLPKQSRIGLLLDNSVETFECILASVFAGMVYVPMDPASPKPRLEHVCNEAKIKAVVFSSSHIGISNHLHWACPSVQSIICIDSPEFLKIQDAVENSPLMNVELWNCVANNAKDDIESGGWKSSYTGEHMSVEEMDEYAENVFNKLKEHIKPTTRVLEIGCASGLTVQKLYTMVDHYVATDLSEAMTSRLERQLNSKGVTNVQVLCATADQIEHLLQGRTFDLIIMNSVVHCFPGHNYLRAVFQSCERLLSEDAVIFVGDVMDLELKEKLIMSLKSFKKAHSECRVKTNWQNELFLSRGFMQHLCDSSTILKSVKTSRKHYTVANELTEFRFDALFTTSSSDSSQSFNLAVHKHTFARRDVAESVKDEDSESLSKVVVDWSRDVQCEDEMYVLYTSGTTGTPKGVIIGHGALLNYVTWAAKAYKFDPSTLTPFFAPLTFDFTITSIFPPLLSGSVIQVFDPFQDSYEAMANSSEITTVKYSPLQLDTIISTTTQVLNASSFILGGEQLTHSLLVKLKKNKGSNPFVVWNEYGPTEATVGCVVRCFTSDELPKKECDHISIGMPIDNVTVAVVRDQRIAVPRGAIGHLAIGGKCLCSDFAGNGLDRDMKRSKSFKASCWGRPGEQMLLTEDLVELMPSSGELVYFGRDSNSETTKVNGVRVDLMEVQRMIEADPLVASAWVSSFTHDNRILLGAAVKLEIGKQDQATHDHVTWKQHLTSSLAQVLPVRSIPKVLVPLSTAPTNKNGKKDVSYLQKIFLAEMIAEKANVCNVMSNLSSPSLSHGASFNAVVKLQRIWQSILPVNHLPKPEEDFFFDLSGDSLQAIHLVRKMRDEGWQVSVTDIFQNPSIGKLVPILVSRECENEDAQIAVEDEATQFLPTPIVQDFFERCPPLKQPDRFSLSALLNFHSKISPEILEKALRSIIVKHSSLRSRFGIANGRVFQKVVPMESTDLNVEMVDMERSEKHLANEPLFVELCKNLEERHSLENGKLVTAAILNVKDERSQANQQHFALLVVHHVALDIVSWQQVLEDLASALKRLDEDDRKELVLPKCQGTFQTFCKALHDEAEEVFAKEVQYWTSVEEESRQSGFLVEANLQSSFQSAKWLSDSIDATSIRLTSRKLGCSDEDMLLTAFGRAMTAIHGHDKTSICLERHGRQLTSVDSTDTVGWCTSRFPVVLNTPLSGVLVDEVKEVGQKIKKIPNHGLGFGLLKSKRALTMALPKIMFVYQGSLDASSKETFDGGRFSFDHIPWIEIMLNELKQGRFHRHPNEYLEFDLEIIAWIHGGELKFGCLFDESVICGKVVEEIIKQARLNIRAIVENAKTKRKKISLEIIPAFNITPECMKSMTDALSHHATIATEIRVQSAEQMLQFLCTSSTSKNQFTADVTVLIPRPRNADEAEELVKACSQSNQRKTSGRSIVMVNTEDLPNTFELPAPLLSEDQISLEVNLRHISCFYDYRSDTEYNMPLTQRGYCYLGAIIARGIRACVWDSKYKVLAVDADYTLWDGECAQGSVRFNQGNFAFHEFLLKKKDEGMVLVILSKNNQADVESVFNVHTNEMKLKKNDFACIMANWESKSRNIRYVANIFNLGIDSFVFVDDNPVECEQMIKSCPEVLTLQLPSSMDLVAPLLENLWALDRVHLSAEASKRTELYRSELERKGDLHGVEGSTKEAVLSLKELLFNWEMELEICKTTLGDLGVVKELYTRATELLQRTNQFKINDLKLDLAETRHDDKIWLVSLRDKHGAYGVVSVLLLDKTPEGFFVVQWVLSCRALGRGVEARIFSEVHKEAGTFEEGMSVKVAINKTERNRPALDFLKTVGIETTTVSSTDLTIVRSDSSSSTSCSEMLHNVKVVSNLTKFLENMNGKSETATHKSNTRSVKNFDHQSTSKDSSTLSETTHESSKESISLSKNPKSQTRTTSLMRLNEWIEKNWTQSEKQQALFHAMFPVVNVATGIASERAERDYDDDQLPERERVLRLSWMEVLNTTNEPQDSDKFIQSGGNSFSAVYLVSILRRKCGIELPIVEVLQNRTYSELKSIINKACLLKEETALDLMGPEPKYLLPLSSAQQRMVLMQQTAPGSAAYVETIAYQTRKLIDPNRIISALVEKHTIFKSKITTSNENLEYSITIDDGMKIEITTEVADDLEGMEIYLKKTTPVMPVIDSNLVNVRYLTAKEYNVLAVHIHHVIVDDVTLSNIASDLDKLVHDGAPNQNTSNPSQTYANYVEQEMTYLRTTQCVDDEEFWKKSFTSLPPESNLAILPKAKSTSFDTTTYNAKHLNLALSTEAAGGIETYCRMVGITEFQYFLSCAVLVLQRYLGIEEVTLAIPVTTRTDEHEKTDGLFVNTILCRISVNHMLTVKEHIECVAAQWLEALRHFRYPLDQVTKQLWKMHGKNSSSFCSVMFNYAIHDRNANQLSVCARDAKMPLSLDVIKDRRANQTEIVAEWADRLIDDGVVERLTDSVAHLCSTAYREHFKCIKEVSVLSPKELNLLQSFSTTSSNTHGIETCLPMHSSFENTVKTRPHLTALVINDRCLSYGELNEFALKIANALNNQIEQGHLRSRPVVIVAKKTEYVIAAILGIWKAGGHFLPVAESNQSSLKDIIGRCKPAAILTNLPTYSFVNVVDGESCSVFSIENLIENTALGNKEIRSKMTANDLAYIIQTSGSSGTPKQCKITHKSLSIIANAWTNLYAMREFKVSVLQWAPLSFDVFVGDVVRALLCTPGQLVICPDERRLDIHYILQLIKNHQITMAEVTPMFGQQLSENAIQDELNSMKVFILGSDVLQPHVYHTVKRKLKKDQRLLNSYGMTEATIDSSFFEGDTLPATRSDTVPIGKPLPGVCFHILDPNTFLPCPVGTVGELYISGEVLASGDIELLDDSHLGRPALKSGDVACWLPSGNVELMGRMDNIVKLRGFRISTAEIENKIVQAVDVVKQACVVPWSDENDVGMSNEFLCAFVVVDQVERGRFTIDRNYVCSNLTGELPYYMLPDIVHIVNEIPFSTNGKVDYKALFPQFPKILETKRADAVRKSSFETPTIKTLKALFAEALGLPNAELVDRQLTFMEQGAHSLILVKFSTLLKQKTSFTVTIADIFSHPTISALDEYVTQETNHFKHVMNQHVLNASEDTSYVDTELDIAITGIGLRLPGNIMTLPQLWEALESGHDLIGDFSERRSKDVLDCVLPVTAQTWSESETFQGAFFKRIDEFDSKFFKIPPGEAKFMSPEQRMFLQVATEALAESKPLSEVRGSKIGVFVGSTDIGYSRLYHPDEATCVSGLLPGMVATRVAYQWDLKGPTMLLDTACSSSLIALKEACESIKRHECDGALVGGVSLVLYPLRTGVFGKTSILSQDFKCRPFDKNATGTVVGEGVICMYVEPLGKALEENRPIYGIVRSVASNSVGHGNGITAPSASSQHDVIQRALKSARVHPSEVTFIEGHGTGTKLGDRIELSALRSVFKDTRDSESELAIGSVKSSFGHLDSAAGILGVLKTLASLGSKQIPPTAHFKTPHTELVNSGLKVPVKTVCWHPNKATSSRIAGVSSFGLTGTNCHAIISEAVTEELDKTRKAGGEHCYHLLVAGSGLKQIRRQLHLHKIHIRTSILKSRTSTVSGMCLTVARRLKEFIKLKANIAWRLVITAKDSTQMLKVVEISEAVTDLKTMIQLAKLRTDIHFFCPQYDNVKPTYPEINLFLQQGTINVQLLFGDESEHIQLSPDVTLVVYNESRHWLEPCEKNPRDVPSFKFNELLGMKLAETRELVRSLTLAPDVDLEETLGTFCSAIIIKLFLNTDVLRDYLVNDKEIEFKTAFSLSQMLTRYKKFFFVMVRELWRNDLLDAAGMDESVHYLDSFVFKCKRLLDADPQIIATHAMHKYPSWADCFRFPLYCSRHLANVVRGNMSPLSVIYPQGDLNFMFQFNKLGDLLGDVYYNMYMQLIALYAKQLSGEGKHVRILEVGAGVGHVTRQLLPKLKDIPNVEYWFTDLGKAFVEHAKTLFADHLHMMNFATFDITKCAPKQGLHGSFDIIVSYNVIHTTQSIMDSVVNLRSCLGSDGKLFIIESAKNETWATLAWGILEGWWFFKDYELRPAEPMIEAEKWERVLRMAGFQSVLTCPNNENERDHVEKCMFVCSNKPGTNAPPDLGWWETDTDSSDAIKKLHELDDASNTDKDQEATGKENSVYDALKKIWSELLGEDNIQPEDDFNSLGGESLLAIQMMSLVKKRIRFQLEIADTFGYPTLGSLAGFISDKMNNETEKDAVIYGVSDPHQHTEVRSSSEYKNDSILKSAFHPFNRSEINEETGTLLMFPGQGSQKVGMCVSLKDSLAARKLFQSAEEILGYNVLDICLGDQVILEQRLKTTEFVQVSLFVGCLAKIEQLRVERPEILAKVTHVAGLSVGEFAALVYAGVIGFRDALKLVFERGKAMENAVWETPTGMVSVFGPGLEKLESFLEKNYPAMMISTYLADNQHTVGGTDDECDAFVESLSGENAADMDVIDVRKLRVAGAFHSPHMKQASLAVNNLLANAKLTRPSLPVIMNVNGNEVDDPLEIQKLLGQQLTAAVKWKQSVLTAYTSGVRRYIEVAPGRVLSSIVKKRIKECDSCDVEFIQV